MKSLIEKLYNEFKPKSRGFITNDEANSIMSILNINEDTKDLQVIRNAVVRYCSEHYKPEDGWDKDKLLGWDIMSASTAVIDNLKYKRGELI